MLVNRLAVDFSVVSPNEAEIQTWESVGTDLDQDLNEASLSMKIWLNQGFQHCQARVALLALEEVPLMWFSLESSLWITC